LPVGEAETLKEAV